MTSQQKYPDTDVFHFHNENPKGRYTGDCFIRAIARATGKTWDEVLDGLYATSKRTKYSIASKECYGRYLEGLGWVKHKQPRKSDGTKYTGTEFCRQLKRYDCELEGDFPIDRIVAHIGGHHIVAIVEGQVNDIWDCTDGCIGNFWTKS